MDKVKHNQREFCKNYPYHVVSKTIDGSPNLTESRILKIIDQILQAASVRFGAVISHYNVMKNHLHIIVETPKNKRGLEKIMQYVKSLIARRVNNIYRNGPLWKDRYFSRVLKCPSMVRNAIIYIYNNPVKAGICSEAWDWKGSSCKAYLTGQKAFLSMYSWIFKKLGLFCNNSGEVLKNILLGQDNFCPKKKTRQLKLKLTLH